MTGLLTSAKSGNLDRFTWLPSERAAAGVTRNQISLYTVKCSSGNLRQTTACLAPPFDRVYLGFHKQTLLLSACQVRSQYRYSCMHILTAPHPSYTSFQRVRYSTLLMTIDLVSTDLLRSALDGARELSNDTCGQTESYQFLLP